MLEQKKFYKVIWGLVIAVQMLVGRFYDERLSFFGINISIIISALFIFFSIWGLILSKKESLSIYFQLYLLFAIALVFTALYFNIFKNNFSNEYGQIKLLEFVFISSLIVIIILFTKDIELLKNVVFFMFCLSFLMLVIGYIVSINRNFSFNDNNRLALLGGGPIVYARWIAIGILYSVYLLNIKLIYKFIYVLLGIFLILLSGSKGPLLALMISIIGVFLIPNLFSKKFLRSMILISILGISSFLTLHYLNNKGFLPERMQQITNFNKFSSATSIISRTERYPASYKIFIDNPFGVGIGNWAYYHNKKSQVKIALDDYPHNIFLELVNESGILVLILFVIIILTTIIRTFLFLKKYKNINNSLKSESDIYKLICYFFAFFIFTFINSNISGDISDNRFLFFSIASLLMLTSINIESNTNKTECAEKL